MVQMVNEPILVLLIVCMAALLTYLGVPLAERYEVSVRLLSEALPHPSIVQPVMGITTEEHSHE
jgi:hypothetical protein